MSNAFDVDVDTAARDAFGLPPIGGPSVTFRKVSLINPFKSAQAGTPQFDAFDFIKVEPQGDTTQIVDRKVNEQDKRQHAAQWAQYQNQQEQVASGTPLTFLFPAEPDIVETLKGHKFHTVEQLADASDTALQGIPMGGFQFREKAVKYLAFSKDAAKFHQIEKALADKDYKLGEQKATIDKMAARLEALEARAGDEDGGEMRRGPGRPRKDAA